MEGEEAMIVFVGVLILCGYALSLVVQYRINRHMMELIEELGRRVMALERRR